MQTTEKKYLGTISHRGAAYLRPDYRPLTCISLFSGCGGAALGISQAGFEVRVMVEWEKEACTTLRTNWTRAGWEKLHQGYIDGLKDPSSIKSKSSREWFAMKRGKRTLAKMIREHEEAIRTGPPRAGTKEGWYRKREPAILEGDITKIPTEDILKAASLRVGEATMLEGGFPCQGFSHANSRRNAEDHTTDSRNVLYLECVRVIREALPKSFMLENVPGLVSMEKGNVIRMICEDLAGCGYSVNWDILNAADYGVPQNRRRVIILGRRNDLVAFPAKGPYQLHIGGAAGPITHPAWFLKKYGDNCKQDDGKRYDRDGGARTKAARHSANTAHT